MSTVPYNGNGYCLKGKFSFTAQYARYPCIDESYELQIIVPYDFPKKNLLITEIGGRIPRSEDFHINGDNTLCLGSNFRMALILSDQISIVNFAEKLIVPYLYAVSLKLKYGYNFVFGELAHGVKGLYQDYLSIFDLKDQGQLDQAFKCITAKKRVANKKICPCGCGRRLSKCTYRCKINELRGLLSAKKLKEIYLDYKINHLGFRNIDRNENRGGHAFNRSHRFRCI